MQVKVTINIHSNINQLALIEGDTMVDKLGTMRAYLEDEYGEPADVFADSAYITLIGSHVVAMYAAEHFI